MSVDRPMQDDEIDEVLSIISGMVPHKQLRLFVVLTEHLTTALQTQIVPAPPPSPIETTKPECPYCAGSDVRKFGQTRGAQRWRCKHCERTFSDLTGTPLAGLNHRDKWAGFEQSMQNGLSIRAAATKCGISTDTAFRWKKRWEKDAKPGPS